MKLVDKFTYLGSSVSSTENEINTRLAKAWTAVDWLLVTWKSVLSNVINVVSILLFGCTTWTLTYRKSLTAIAQECYELCWKNPRNNIPQNSNCAATYRPSKKPSKLNEQDMRDTAGEVKTNSLAMSSSGQLHASTSARFRRDVIWKTCRERWTIETNGERELGKSVQVAWKDDGDDDDDEFLNHYAS